MITEPMRARGRDSRRSTANYAMYLRARRPGVGLELARTAPASVSNELNAVCSRSIACSAA